MNRPKVTPITFFDHYWMQIGILCAILVYEFRFTFDPSYILYAIWLCTVGQFVIGATGYNDRLQIAGNYIKRGAAFTSNHLIYLIIIPTCSWLFHYEHYVTFTLYFFTCAMMMDSRIKIVQLINELYDYDEQNSAPPPPPTRFVPENVKRAEQKRFISKLNETKESVHTTGIEKC